jgi:nucleotide-binding universal stress UspA family protein
MKNIVVLIDFTRVCEPAIAQAGRIARKSNSKLILLHIAPEEQRENFDKLIAELDIFAEVLGKNPINLVRHIEFGDFMTIIGNTLQMLNTDLIVVGTHGIRGRQRNLFSRNIAALLQELKMPTIIVQGQQELEPSELDSWLVAGDRMNDGLDAVSWLKEFYQPGIRFSVAATEPESIETEAFDNDCSLIVWQGNAEQGMDLILNHFGIPVLLL